MKKKNKAAQALAKLRHKKSPKTKDYYSRIGKLGAEKRWKGKKEKWQQKRKK